MTATPHTVVITGGNGFVGGHLQAELASAWPTTKVISWDLPDVDITDPTTYTEQLANLQPDWVVHLAAIASVPASLKNPDLTRQVNTEGTRLLFEALQSVSQSTKVLFISSADIYGAELASAGKPLVEQPLSAADPGNPYAESKKAAEQIIEDSYNPVTIRVRPFPHIGPGQGVGFVTADFASQIVALERAGGGVLTVGTRTTQRDFTDVRDVVRAYRLLMEGGTLGEVYHVASGRAVSIQTILDVLLKQSTVSISVAEDETRRRPNDIPIIVGDAGKLTAATDWSPTIPLEQSLSDILTWWRQNLQ